ncbi:MAG: hypothetical protein ACSHX6_09525 [Akkermansiaceae bacterium]
MTYIRSLYKILPLILISDLSAQLPTNNTDEESTKKTLKVKILALGHRRTATYTRSKKAEVIRFTTPDGETIEEVIPAGTAVEVRGSRYEYLPSRIYIPNKNKETGEEHMLRPLILNACSPEISLKPRQNLDVYIRKAPRQEGKELELTKYFSTSIAEEQTHLLTTIIKRHTVATAWEKPIIKSFNTSYDKLPPKSLLIFNACPLPIEVQVPSKQKIENITIKPLSTFKTIPGVNTRGETVVLAKIVYPDGKKRQFYYNSLNIAQDGRAYLFVYCDPRKNATNLANTVQFYDTIEPPVKK